MSLTSIQAQDMRQIARNIPDSIMPLLTSNDRLDFIDYLDSNMKAEVTNKLGGKSEMTTISNDYAHIRMTANSDMALKLLPFEGDTIICIIHTYSSAASDSRLKFYTKQWQQLPSREFFTPPLVNDFIIPTDTLTETERANMLNKLDVTLVKAEFAKESTNLHLTLTTPTYMSEEDRKAATPHIKTTIIRKWNGKRFE